MRMIDRIFSVIPWECVENDCKKAYSYNFLSFVKPWLKRRENQWDEEKLWSDILITMQPTNIKLLSLIDEQLKIYHQKYLEMTYNEKKKYYGKNEHNDYGKLVVKDLQKLLV